MGIRSDAYLSQQFKAAALLQRIFMGSKSKGTDVLDLSGKILSAVGLLAFLAYMAGIGRLYFFYKSLDCLWIIDFLSYPEVVLNGAPDVSFFVCSGLIFFYSFKTPADIDNHGRRIIGLIFAGILIAILIAWIFLDFTPSMSMWNMLRYASYYGFLGVSGAATFRYMINVNRYSLALALGAVFIGASLFGSYQIYNDKTIEDYVHFNYFPYAVENKHGNDYLYISSIGSKYFVKDCSTVSSFKLFSPSEAWKIRRKELRGCASNFSSASPGEH